MPAIGKVAKQNCPECGKPMVWSKDAARERDSLAETSRGMKSQITHADAYRCENGHTTARCPVCSSYDTFMWGRTDRLQEQIACVTCGTNSILDR